MALQEPPGLENLQPPPLVAPPLVAGRENTWITASHGSSTLPFVVSRPSADAGEANSIVLLLPGCGHFYVENMHPLPWQGAIEYLWSNLAFKKAVIACAWPVAGQAGSPPAWMLPDGAAWTKAVYTMEILPLLLAVQRDASPRISLPTYLMGLGSGGTITYQIAISEAHATFRACVCMGPIRLPSLLPAPTSGETRILVYGGRKDVETFQFGCATRCGAIIACLLSQKPFPKTHTLPPSRATDARSTSGPPASQSARWLSARTRSMWCGLHC